MPIGHRVLRVSVGGTPLELDEAYSVTTLDFLGSGADLYTGFTEATVVVGDGPPFATLLEARFAGDEPVSAPARGRIIPIRQKK